VGCLAQVSDMWTGVRGRSVCRDGKGQWGDEIGSKWTKGGSISGGVAQWFPECQFRWLNSGRSGQGGQGKRRWLHRSDHGGQCLQYGLVNGQGARRWGSLWSVRSRRKVSLVCCIEARKSEAQAWRDGGLDVVALLKTSTARRWEREGMAQWRKRAAMVWRSVMRLDSLKMLVSNLVAAAVI
jgi:hypothetical protein